MAMEIEGGRNGTKVLVSDNNELYTYSLDRDIIQQKALDGELYLMTTYGMPMSTTEGAIFHVDFTSTDKYMVFDRFQLGWNGGNTNHNRCCTVSYEIGTTAPTTNTTPGFTVNTNSGSPKTLEATITKWNQVGTGMSGHTPGVRVGQVLVNQGLHYHIFEGRFLFEPGTKFMLYCDAEEAGNFMFTAYVYTIDINTLK